MKRVIALGSIVLFFITVASECGKDKTPEEILRDEMLFEINKLRSSGCFCGPDSMPPVPELKWDASLTQAATRHVTDMVTHEFFNHIGSDGSTPASRALDAGYAGAYIGENIARGYITLKDVMDRWESSESHCKSMMDFHYLYIGAAADQFYWVQVLGSE
jgi:uncharacterized protein YkwD